MLRQIIVPALLALVVLCFVGVANELRERSNSIAVIQIQAMDIARLALYFLPTLIAYIIPITFMMGVLMGFGQLAHRGEMIAIKAGGVSLRHIVVPVVICGAVLSACCFVVQDRVQPWAVSAANKLVHTELPSRLTLDILPVGQMHDFENWRVYIGGRDPETGMLRNIDIVESKENGSSKVYYAESAELIRKDGKMKLLMKNVRMIVLNKDKDAIPSTFGSTELAVPTPNPKGRVSRKSALTIGQLFARQKELRGQFDESGLPAYSKQLRGIQGELFDRFALSFACLAVAFVAAPVAARMKRSGRSYTFGIGLAIGLAYYLLLVIMEPKLLCPLPQVLMRSAVPNLVLCLTGGLLLWRVDRV